MVEPVQRRVPTVPSREWLRELPPAVRFAFHADAAARAAVAPLWGAACAEEPCRATTHANRATLWLGPDEYLLLDFQAGTAAASLANELEGALAHVPHALVDISHRQFAFELVGAQAETILSGACPLDLDLTQFPVGMCTRTILAKADITLWRPRADAFHLEVWRSFAGYVVGVLTEIAAEFYPLP